MTAPRRAISHTEQINRLIAWYEQFKPTAGTRIPVFLTPRQLAKALHKLPDNPPDDYIPPREHSYRGRTLVATAKE